MVEKVKDLIHIVQGKKLIALAVGGVAFLVAVGAIILYMGNKSGTEENRGFQMFAGAGSESAADYVAASGTTTLGYDMDEFEPDYIETDLYIEEVYISSGDEVTKGTPVFKVNEQSIVEAREELEGKVEETSLAYRAGVISYEQSKINAKYTYDVTMLGGQQAEAVYNSAVKAAEDKLQEAQDAVTEAEGQIEEYTNATENGSYYYEYDVDEYEERYNTNYNLFCQLLSEWGIAESELFGSAGGNISGSVEEKESGEGENKKDTGDAVNEEGEDSGDEENTENEEGENTGGTDDTVSEEGEDTGDNSEDEGDSGNGEGENTGDTDDAVNEEGEGTGDEGNNQNEEGENTGDTDDTGNQEGEDTGNEGDSENKAEEGTIEARDSENTNNTGENKSQDVKEQEVTTTFLLERGSAASTMLAAAKRKEVVYTFMSISNSEAESDKERQQKIAILQQLKKAVESSETAYKKAVEEYESATEKAAVQLKKLNTKIESLRADLTEAETTYQLEILAAETTYKKAAAQTELAQSDYEAAMQKASDELEALKDEKEEAQKNLAEFEELLGDGYFYTQSAGTVMMVGCKSETNLQGGSMVVAYRNPEDISVMVAVPQKDIDKLRVGDSAEVIIEEYGTYEGEITYLNPISTSDSRTNITYEVIVSLRGDEVSSLTENLTASVIFQTGDREE